jgi:protein TonB
LVDRLEEEWLADLEARPGPWSRMLLGIGCCWAATVIAQENLGLGLTAASTTGNKAMSGYAPTSESLVPQRTTALAIIIALHVALVFAFATGLAHRVITALPPVIIGTVDYESKNLPPPPKLSEPKLRDPQPVIPEYVPAELPNTDPETAIHSTPVTAEIRDPGPPISPPAPIQRVVGDAGKGFPSSAEYYPPSAIRMNETGTTIVQVCVNSKGYLTGTPTLKKSSQSARLDEGALKLARAGSGHYRPTTENGQPVDSCFPLDITFNLKD